MANTIASSMAKKAGNASIAGNNGAYSNGGSGKDECSDDMPSTESKVCTMEPICHGGG